MSGDATLALEAVNSLDRNGFVGRFGGVFEHSPWVAAQAWNARPFASLDALHAAMLDAVERAPRERQLALLRSHPELAGREAQAGGLTPDSSTEQGRLGFTALSLGEHERMSRLNRAYREKFGFPAIVALALHAKRDTVFAEFERRIGNDLETEIANALGEVAHIARARLATLVSV